MIRVCSLITCALALVLVVPGACSGQQVRNPFGLKDVNNPSGDDVRQFAKRVQLSGGPNDTNAPQWVSTTTKGKPESLDGDWSGRWGEGEGFAKVRVRNGRVYVLYTDSVGPYKDVSWLLEAIQEEKGRLVGRWEQVGNPRDTGPYCGLIVNPERIDGTWGGDARWDFRRHLAQ